MYSYYPIISKNKNLLNIKTIFPQNIGYISFIQLIKIKTNKTYLFNNEPIYGYTNRRQDFILLNKGKIEINLVNKMLDKEINIILDENLLIKDNKKIINEPVLFNISSSIYYNIKPLTYSEFLFYSSDYSNIDSDVNFDYYKLDKKSNSYSKYSSEIYPYFDFNEKEYSI